MIRALAGAFIGAAAAAAALFAFSLLDPAITLEMNRDVPRPLANGLYPIEEIGDETYAWTGPLTTFNFRDLSRRSEWRCIARLRGARPPGLPQPEVAIGVDGLTVVTHVGGPHYEDAEVVAPSRATPGLRLSISTSPVFVPATDPRQLGVQLDRLECTPQGSGWVFPARGPLIAAAVAGAAFGALFGILGSPVWVGCAVAVFSLAIAWLLHTGIAPFAPAYLTWIAPLALWIAVPAVAAGILVARRASAAARFVLGFSAAVLFLKLVALMHPSKAIVDAVFHAHRLEWVLDGRYFFTQPMPGGVQFPYAIALYVTAAPFTSILHDHVALLRIVVCVFEAFGAGLLYLVVARLWGDRLAAALAVVCYHLVPLPYAVIGNANLTYAFGHGVSLLAFASVALLTLRWRQVGTLILLGLVATVAFLSHVAVFPLLAVALALTGVLYALSKDPAVRPSGLPVIGTSVVAAVLAFGVYYAHFPEVYRTLDRVRSTTVDTSTTPQTPVPAALPPATRVVRAASLGVRDLGIPLALLTCAGLWMRVRAGGDRLDRVLAGWGIAFVLFVGFRVIAPVDPRLQRYADEFIDRVYYATLPAIVILAAWAAARGWTAGTAQRLVVCGLLVWAAGSGASTWMNWLR